MTFPWQSDPLWREAKAMADHFPAIRITHHLARFNEIVLFCRDMVGLYGKYGIDQTIARFSNPPPQLEMILGDSPFFEGVTDAQKEEIRKGFSEQYLANQRVKALQPVSWTMNQALVMLCTAFDLFLEDLVDVVLQTKKEILYGAAGAKNIELKQVVSLGTVEAILEAFRKKEIDQFAFEDIRARFGYLEKRLGLDLADLWNRINQAGTPPIRSLESLAEIYGKRHAIVHRDELPIRAMSELDDVEQFLGQLLFHLCVLVLRKHGAQNEMSHAQLMQYFWKELKKKKDEGGESNPATG